MTEVVVSHRVTGTGDPVVLVMGTGATGRVWHLHQVPALVDAGFRVVTFDHRGIGASPAETAYDFELADLVDDVAGLVTRLGLAPCRMVGFSLGAFVVQELALARPELLDRMVLMATRGRDDTFRAAVSAADRALYDSGAAVPPAYRAVATMALNLSPATLDSDRAARDWLDILETAAELDGPAYRRQLEIDQMPDRLASYQDIAVPTLVLAFADDRLCPPRLAREVADAIPGAAYREVAECGHFGYLERPDEVNKHLVDFLSGPPAGGVSPWR